MKISCETRGKNLIARIEGDIDHHSSGEIRDTIDKAFERSGAKNIIINFEKVGFMDSSGIGVLIGRYKMLENRAEGGRLISACLSENVSRLFDISGLTKIITRAGTVNDAIALAGAGGGV